MYTHFWGGGEMDSMAAANYFRAYGTNCLGFPELFLP